MHGFRPGIVTIGLGLSIIGATPCFAQLNSTGTGLSTTGTAMQHNLTRANQGKAPEAQPPVLPGTKSASEPAEPTAAPTSMSPNEALFDAINRGDLASARDAINRGAELSAHNLLDLTPLELSIDLGRNDISFMLLSMRGDTAAVRQEARMGVQAGMQRQAVETPRQVSRARVIAASASDDQVTATPRYSPGNGGSPIPAAGFLGFDEGRQSH
jgi:hypothetical protein